MVDTEFDVPDASSYNPDDYKLKVRDPIALVAFTGTGIALDIGYDFIEAGIGTAVPKSSRLLKSSP